MAGHIIEIPGIDRREFSPASSSIVSDQDRVFRQLEVAMDQVDTKDLVCAVSHKDLGDQLKNMPNFRLFFVCRKAVVSASGLSMRG